MINEPFEGTPPDVEAGDSIEIQDANGTWHRSTAKSAPRYDRDNAHGRRCWLTVAVLLSNGRVFNWPAEAVRRRS